MVGRGRHRQDTFVIFWLPNFRELVLEEKLFLRAQIQDPECLFRETSENDVYIGLKKVENIENRFIYEEKRVENPNPQILISGIPWTFCRGISYCSTISFCICSIEGSREHKTTPGNALSWITCENILELVQLSGFNFGELGLDTLPR